MFSHKFHGFCPSQRQVALLEATESLRRGEKFSKSSVSQWQENLCKMALTKTDLHEFCPSNVKPSCSLCPLW